MYLQFTDIFKDLEEKFGLPATAARNDLNTTPAGGQCFPVTSSNDAVENFSFTVTVHYKIKTFEVKNYYIGLSW